MVGWVFAHYAVDQDAVGPAVVETYALNYAGGAPVAATVACLRDEGQRRWATIRDPAVLEAMTREEFCGRLVRLREDDQLDVE